MKRDVSSRIVLNVTEPADLIFAIAVSRPLRLKAASRSPRRSTVRPIDWHEVPDAHGTRLHRVQQRGRRARGAVRGDRHRRGRGRRRRPRRTCSSTRRPSRYAESDSLGPTAYAEFAGITDAAELLPLGVVVGRHPPVLRQRLEPADRRRHPHPARPAGRLPRLRAPVRGAAARTRTCPARLVAGVRARTVSDGLPRGRRGARRRGVAGRRRDDARAAIDPRAHRHGPGCRRRRVPHGRSRVAPTSSTWRYRRSSTCSPTTTSPSWSNSTSVNQLTSRVSTG